MFIEDLLQSIKMSLDSQKLDSNQRQQIMATVQQQLAIQNAQELLQVNSLRKILVIIFRIVLFIVEIIG